MLKLNITSNKITMSKKIILIVSIVIVIAVIILGAIVLISKNAMTNLFVTSQPVVTLPDHSAEIAQDLQTAFTKATSTLGLSDKSLFMVNAYAGDETKPTDIAFAQDASTTGNQFYLASAIKPLLATAYIKILDIKDLDYKIPFKFADDGKILEGIAGDLYNKINNNYDEDVLLDLYILPFFKDYTSISREEILNILKTNPDIVNFNYTLTDVIKYTLGPSSNFGPTLIRSDLALKKGIDEEQASNLMEEYLNKMLTDKGYEGSLVVNKSTKSKALSTLNSAKFYEVEYLFDWFYKNEFKLNADAFSLMKESMREVGSDPVKFNRRHETKTIAKKVYGINPFHIDEKSGYIGFDYEAAPGLNKANGWDTLPAQEGKRIVFFDGCAFARIYLNNGKFVQYNFSIASPIYISTDPSYEELNPDYTQVKNKIFDSLEENIGAVLLKYKKDIASK